MLCIGKHTHTQQCQSLNPASVQYSPRFTSVYSGFSHFSLHFLVLTFLPLVQAFHAADLHPITMVLKHTARARALAQPRVLNICEITAQTRKHWISWEWRRRPSGGNSLRARDLALCFSFCALLFLLRVQGERESSERPVTLLYVHQKKKKTLYAWYVFVFIKTTSFH